LTRIPKKRKEEEEENRQNTKKPTKSNTKLRNVGDDKVRTKIGKRLESRKKWGQKR